MKKPIIAVIPLWDDEKNSIWMLPGYMDGISKAGGVPVILPLHSSAEDVMEAFETCDGLLMTGGHDVSPMLYREGIKDTCGTLCTARDLIESALYEKALETGKHVLGICRGIQIINVLQGGSLYQDLPTEFGSSVEHHMKPPYTDTAHNVNIEQDSPLYEMFHVKHLGVNSCHHQGIKQLGDNLEVMARAEDGLIEAVRHTYQKYVWAFQWHPEFDFHVNPASKKIFDSFIGACRQ
ncbi:MAG: gamma-glutamyl-gamma-aminobutyrate hydrolase family protein [Lachnospiraceae bacterium]|nr:gamma-glutamyl-gamma-aminobutyrate hydrolase family protein [Lachnospiraceae bacterium]